MLAAIRRLHCRSRGASREGADRGAITVSFAGTFRVRLPRSKILETASVPSGNTVPGSVVNTCERLYGSGVRWKSGYVLRRYYFRGLPRRFLPALT